MGVLDQSINMSFEQNQRIQAEVQFTDNFDSYHFAQMNKELEHQCPICLKVFQKINMYSLSQCEHLFCQQCLSQYVHTQLMRYSKLTCPEQQCSKEFNETGPYFNKLTPNQINKLNKIQIYYKIVANTLLKPCYKQECMGIINLQELQPHCSFCKKLHCALCYRLSHIGQCEVKVVISLQMSSKYRQCSKCGQIIEKTEGCTHISCPCGHYFCYSCGQTLAGEHTCKVPQQLSCLQKIRWEIEHEQLWYQGQNMNFLRYLNYVSLSKQKKIVQKMLWAIIYTLIVCPITIIVSLIISFITFAVFISLILVLSMCIPFLGLCSRDKLNLFPTQIIFEHFGCLAALVVVIIFYPILYFINMVQVVYQIIVKQQLTTKQLCTFGIHLVLGLRNFAMIPCLMFIDNQSFYLTEANNRQKRENGLKLPL